MSMKPLAIIDIETDPFLYGRVPMPFVVGLYRGPDHNFEYWWGPDCIARCVARLEQLETEHIIYAHNGGKFDFLYFIKYLEGNLKIINGRIVETHIAGHTCRDSYAVLPFPLRDYKKDEIDYRLMEADKREKPQNKKKILEYFHGDHKYLYEMVAGLHEEFGQQKITVGSIAMEKIREHHPFPKASLQFDRVFRPSFFYGGRVQCFKSGIIPGIVNIYDVNSMYPAVMREFEHPTGLSYHVGTEVTSATRFVTVTGWNKGAFPLRTDGGLTFAGTHGTYNVTRWEYDAAIATGTFVPQQIERTYDFDDTGTFASFVDHYFSARAKARDMGDDIRALLFKFVLNSGYGKFAQNPSKFYDWSLATLKCRPRERCPHCRGRGVCEDCWKCRVLNDYEPTSGACMFCGGDGERWHLHEYDGNNPSGPMLWRARIFAASYYNVAIGASITGAARSLLLRGIAMAEDPLYCDTDSIITGGHFSGPVGKELGQWKHEGTGCLSAIAGKKLYCIFADKAPSLSSEDERKYPWMLKPVRYKRVKYWPVKKAHKGLRLTPEEILQIADGWEIEKPSDAPSFSLFAGPMTVPPERQHKLFMSRTARITA